MRALAPEGRSAQADPLSILVLFGWRALPLPPVASPQQRFVPALLARPGIESQHRKHPPPKKPASLNSVHPVGAALGTMNRAPLLGFRGNAAGNRFLRVVLVHLGLLRNFRSDPCRRRKLHPGLAPLKRFSLPIARVTAKSKFTGISNCILASLELVSKTCFVSGHDRGTHPVGGSRAAKAA